MSEHSTFPIGAPCWADLQSTDPAAARAFYAEVLGWSFEIAGEEFGGYAQALVEGQRVAGVAGPTPEPPARSAWTVYLHAPDLGATVAAATAAGAAVLLPPAQAGPFGHMALLSDPGGAVFGLWQPLAHLGFERTDLPGAQCWAEVATRGGEAVAQFYADLFGMTSSLMPEMAYWTMTSPSSPEAMRFGVLQMTAEWEGLDPHWMIYFATDSADAAAARVRAAGGVVHHGPFDSAYGRIVVVSDRTGAVFSLLEPSALALAS